METDTPVNEIESLLERVETYAKTSYELAKLKSLNAATEVSTSLISRLSVIIMASLFVLIFNIGVALLLGELLGKNYYGFFIVAGFYLIASIVLHYFMYKWIKKPVSDSIILQALQ